MRFWIVVWSRLAGRSLAVEMAGDLAERRLSFLATQWAALAMTVTLAAARVADAGRRLVRARGGLGNIGGESRQALRALRRAPASSLVIVLTLAAGLGVNSAIFSVVYGVLFQPLPFADPDRVVIIEGMKGAAAAPASIYSTSMDDFRDYERSNRTFESLGLAGYWTFTLGSSRAGVVSALARDQFGAVMIGLITGIVVTAWAVRFVAWVLYCVSAFDVRVWSVAICAIVGIAALGALIPSLRASRVDPVRALKDE